VYKHILINAEFQVGKRSKKTADWEKSIKEAKVHIGLQCHRRRREEVHLFYFTNCCHVISCHYKRHGVEARNSS